MYVLTIREIALVVRVTGFLKICKRKLNRMVGSWARVSDYKMVYPAVAIVGN